MDLSRTNIIWKVIEARGRENLDTKLKGDIAEQAAVLRALKQGWGVLQPVGDRLPYDLAFDIQGRFVRIQVKSAWFCQRT